MSEVTDKAVETLAPTLNNILISLIDTTTKAKDFVVGQIPDVVHQLLVWRLYESGFWFVFNVMIICITVYVSFYICRKVKAREWDDDALIFLIFNLALIIPVGIAIKTLLDFVKIIVAPKLYLIEYAASLMK